MSLQVWLPLIKDISNQGLSGISATNNGATVNDNGKLGKCYYFNGDAQYLQLSATLGDLYSHDFSYSVWLKPTDSTRSIIMSDYASSGASGVAYELTTSRSIRLYWNGLPDIYPSNCVLPLDTWTHTAIVKTTNRVDFYVNGELRHTYTGTLVDRVSSSCLRIGDDYRGGSSVSYMGYMNDVRIYNHALSAKEVKELSKGLVAHYTLGDSYLEGTTNLVTSLTKGGQTTVSGNSVTTSGENKDTYFTMNLSESIVSGTQYTVSCYAEGIPDGSYWTFPLGSQNNTSLSWLIYNGYNSYTFTANAIDWGTNRLFMDDLNRNYYGVTRFYDFQLEKKDHATGYAGLCGTRNDTTVYDSSGYNYHGTINTAQTISSTTARYSVSTNFNGTDNAIKIPFNAMLGLTAAGKTDYTISVWTYKTAIGSKGYQTILGGPSGFELEARNAAETNPVYVAWNWGKNTGTYEFNKWCLFTFVHTTTDNKIYVNGELASSGSAANVPIGDFFIGSWRDVSSQNYQGSMSDFRIYATALSADDIKELYQVGQSISKNKTLFAYAFNEPDNGELMNTRYTESYSTHDNNHPYTKINLSGEYYFDGNNTSAGSVYVPVNPTGKVYYYDMMLSVNTGNQFYVGWERYDKDFTPRSNQACVYVYATKPTADVVKVRFRGTVDLSTDGVNPCAYVALRILNGWSGTTSGVTGTATIHYLSLREVGSSIACNTSFGKNGIATTKLLLEKNGIGDIEKTGVVNMTNFMEI